MSTSSIVPTVDSSNSPAQIGSSDNDKDSRPSDLGLAHQASFSKSFAGAEPTAIAEDGAGGVNTVIKQSSFSRTGSFIRQLTGNKGSFSIQSSGDDLQLTKTSVGTAPKLKLKGNGDWRSRGADDPGDWFGNSPLHHAFSNRDEIKTEDIKTLLNGCPEMVMKKNQFDRIPLHYAVDRIKVNLDAVRLLLNIHPKGVSEEDSEGVSPYDLAVKWQHSNKLVLMMLRCDPSHDLTNYYVLKYGCIGIWYSDCFSIPERRRLMSAYNYVSSRWEVEEDEEEEGVGGDPSPTDDETRIVKET